MMPSSPAAMMCANRCSGPVIVDDDDDGPCIAFDSRSEFLITAVANTRMAALLWHKCVRLQASAAARTPFLECAI